MKSEHTLKIKKGSTTYTCDLYTSQEEARSVLYPNYPILCIEDPDYGMHYAAFTPTLDSATESTPLLTTKNGTNFCLAQKSYFPVDVTAVANATITVKVYSVPYIDVTRNNETHKYVVDIFFEIANATKNGLPIKWLIEIKPFNQSITPKITKRKTR